MAGRSISREGHSPWPFRAIISASQTSPIIVEVVVVAAVALALLVETECEVEAVIVLVALVVVVVVGIGLVSMVVVAAQPRGRATQLRRTAHQATGGIAQSGYRVAQSRGVAA